MLRRAFPLVCLLATLALVTGCAGAKTTASAVPESASLAPADALAYATVTTDPGSDQWQDAESLLERIPGLRDGLASSVTKCRANTVKSLVSSRQSGVKQSRALRPDDAE